MESSPSPEVLSALAKLEDLSTNQQDKPTGYKRILDQLILQVNDIQVAADLSALIDSVLGETLGIVAARPLLDASILAIKSIPNTEVRLTAGTHALSVLEPRVGSFEEQDAAIREILADAYQAQEEYMEAAKILQGIKLESSQRLISDESKIRTWMRICRLYLEEEDTTSAESYLNRAKNLLYKVEDPELNLTFQLSQARILDSRRRFLDASQGYHNFSLSTSLDDEERMRGLSSAIICAVLAPAGPQRSRTLAKLYKDERAPQAGEFGILEKMFLDRLLSTAEVATFAAKLAPHQLAQTSDGSTVLAKAVIEHNLLSASRLYDNIGVSELGVLLGLESDRAEQYAARMLEQKRLGGRIDQISRVIFFDGNEGGQSGGAEATTGLFNSLRKWDVRVQGLAEEVERVTSFLQPNFPIT
jgi:COP9 signalosome complex subunit 4